MKIKKIIAALVISTLSVCLFFVFGFQIDVAGKATAAGGEAEVILEPSKVAADLANAAVEEAEFALEEALVARAAVQAVYDAAVSGELELLLVAAQKAVTDAESVLAGLTEDDEGYEDALLALKEAKAALLVVEVLYGVTPEELETALKEADKAVEDAKNALEAAILAAKEANEAYSGDGGVIDEEKLKELQLAVEKAQKALEDAELAGLSEEEIEELEKALKEAEDALKDAESGEDSGKGGNGSFHIITNSNNGGSFNVEGNHSGNAGEIVSYTFTADEGYELAWIRVGNTKIYASDFENLLDFSFDKKNLTMHAHFKKDKDYEPEEEIITSDDEGEPEEGGEPQEEEDEEKNNGNGKAKGKDKEKSNNGKKK